MKNFLLLTFKIILLLSGTYLSLIFNQRSESFLMSAFGGNKSLVLACICLLGAVVFVGLFVLLFKAGFLEQLYARLVKKPLFVRILLLLYSMACTTVYFSGYISALHNHSHTRIESPETWFAAPPLWVIVLPLTLLYLFFTTALVDFFKSLFKSFNGYEWKFFIIASVIGISYIDFLYNSTTLYYGGWDQIYSYDAIPASYLVEPFYIWSYYQYPLQPNFSMPLLLIAEPFMLFGEVWAAVVRTSIQFVLLLTALIMLSRLVSDNLKVRLLSLLIFTFSFQTLILAVINERRVIPLVFLVIAVYHSIVQKKKKGERSFWLSIASGAVICNGYVALLAIRSKKTAVKDLLLCGGVFLFITSFLGKISGLINLRWQVNNFENHGWLDTGLDFASKLTHYLYFVASSFVSPPSQVVWYPFGWYSWWQAEPSASSAYFWLGAVIFGVAVAGFILNFKKLFAQIAIICVAVSFFFVFVNSLNVSENAVVLNTLFYAWGFISLVVMAIDKVFTRERAKTFVLSAVAAGSLIWNLSAAIEIYKFAVEVHPA